MHFAMSSTREVLIRATAARYRSSGLMPYHFASNKIRFDPVFFAILKSGLIQDRARVLDLGCGQGLLLALLNTADSQYRRGVWADDLASPPAHLRMQGIEMRAHEVATARRALGDEAVISERNLVSSEIPAADVMVMLDVLHYLDDSSQVNLIQRIAKSIPRDGLLLVREADAGGGKSFRLTKFAEQFASINRGNWHQRFCFRSRDEWNALFQANGFAVSDMPMSEGTPFANLLWVARRMA